MTSYGYALQGGGLATYDWRVCDGSQPYLAIHNSRIHDNQAAKVSPPITPLMQIQRPTLRWRVAPCSLLLLISGWWTVPWF